ncbi:MAG: hypothetical protein IJF27_05485 [Oscillospiraceae bacterium]|nr:hypothetical protein [Oscillospiraceae bacterium]MBQ3050149.1 hypothetical protein [Oscillospiraceae bacterium]MBQ9938503.1 hypothetical protein [Oscillospiraceae bacterium]
MRNKAFLSLMELICMAGVFALAATICIRGFLLANTVSNDRRALDNAVRAAQNAAELMKACSGDADAAADILCGTAEEDSLLVFYDSEWLPVENEAEAEYILRSVPSETDAELVAKSEITVSRGEEQLFSLTVGWQEEDVREKP